MWKDEIIEALHASREAHARQFNFDLSAIVAGLRQQEQASTHPFVTRPPRSPRVIDDALRSTVHPVTASHRSE